MNSPQIRVREVSSKSACFFETLQPITRIFGIFTAIVLCGVGVDITVHQRPSGVYLLVSSLLVFWLEIVWAVTLFLQLCIRPDCSTLWRCWDCITWIDGWKKTIVYGALSALPIAWPCKLWLSYVAGGQLIALALLYLVLSFKGKRRRKRKDHLLGHGEADSFESYKRLLRSTSTGIFPPSENGDDSPSDISPSLSPRHTTSNRFEEVTEVLDDGLPEPIPGSSHSLSDSLAEQEAILEI